MEIMALIKLLDVVSAFVAGGFTFDAAFTKVSNFIKGKQESGATEISDEDLLSLFDGTGEKIRKAREQYDRTLADPNTPKR